MKHLFNVLSLIYNTIHSRIGVILSGHKALEFEYAISHNKPRKLDIYLPAKRAQPVPLIIFLHGGGWFGGSKKWIHPGVLKQVRRGYALASISYSFIQHATWPAQAFEVKAAIRWLRANAQDLGIDPGCFMVWGTSSGGQIGNVIGTSSGSGELEGDLGNDGYSSEVQGVATWYGPSDLVRMGNNDIFDKVMKRVLSGLIGEDIDANPEKAALANPISFINPATPPFYLIHGTSDRIVNINQSELLYEALTQSGVKATYTVKHGYYHADPRFSFQENLKEVETFLDSIAFPLEKISISKS